MQTVRARDTLPTFGAKRRLSDYNFRPFTGSLECNQHVTSLNIKILEDLF